MKAFRDRLYMMAYTCGGESFTLEHLLKNLRFEDPKLMVLKRSEALLYSHLNSKQKQEYSLHQRFAAYGNKTRLKYVLYRFCRGIRGDGVILEFNLPIVNTFRFEKKRRDIIWFCSYNTKVPVFDELLAKKLLIENDEDEFIKQAHYHPFRDEKEMVRYITMCKEATKKAHWKRFL